MAQVAVNKDGSEVIGIRLERFGYNDNGSLIRMGTQGFCWKDMEIVERSYYLPKGSIKKLIGRDLTWEDEPVTL